MTNLETIANYAEILGTFTILSGVIFGLSQIRMHRIMAQNTIAAQLSQTFMDKDLARAVDKIRQLPDDATPEQVAKAGAQMSEAATIVTTSFETIGLLVHRGIADKELALDLAGGIMGSTWRKLHVWQKHIRTEQAQPSWAEWYEWLAEQSYDFKGTKPPKRHIQPSEPTMLDNTRSGQAFNVLLRLAK